MGLIVQKFGGTSVADADCIRRVAGIITDTYKKGNQVVAVLSAQGDTTDDLIAMAGQINPRASSREMDMLLSVGEQISVSLCANSEIARPLRPGISRGLPHWLAGGDDYQHGLRKCPHQGGGDGAGPGGVKPQPDCDCHRISGNQPKWGYHYSGKGRLRHLGGGPAASLDADLCQIYTDVRRCVHGGSPAGEGGEEAGRGDRQRDAGVSHIGRPGAPQPIRGDG